MGRQQPARSTDPGTAVDRSRPEGAEGAGEVPPLFREFPFNLALKLLAKDDLRPTPAQRARFRSFASAGDPLADAVVDLFKGPGAAAVKAMVDQGLAQGVDSLDDPPAPLERFLRAVESTPYWVDHSLIDEGARAIGRTGFLGVLPLGDVALMGGYLASRATKTLLGTGNLDALAPRRLAETGAWWGSITTPGALRLGGEGYSQAVRVRLVHAHVRAAMMRRDDWDYESWDHPVNQVQTAGTLLLFSHIYLLAIRFLGVRYTPREEEAILHLWRYVGWLMGVDDELLPATRTDAWRLMWLLADTEFLPDDDSKRLASALVRARREMSPLPRRIPGTGVAIDLLAQTNAGYSRLALGNRNGDLLGLPPARIGRAAVLAFGTFNFAAETLRRMIPGATSVQTFVGLRSRKWAIDQLVARSGADLSFAPDAADRLRASAGSGDRALASAG